MTGTALKNEYERIGDKMIDWNVYGELEIDRETDNVMIEIFWGDWKHDHLMCDWMMKELGYELLTAIVTQEDGSDCYSAVRVYKRKEN